jgi:hypothetical protein
VGNLASEFEGAADVGAPACYRAKRFVHFGRRRPVHHTSDARLDITATATGNGVVLSGGPADLVRIWQAIDHLAQQQVSDQQQTADLIKRQIGEHDAVQRAKTRRQVLITAIGLAFTIAGIALRLVAGILAG